MKKNLIKLNLVLGLLILQTQGVLAIGFDEAEAKRLATSYTGPFTTFLLWAVPIICVIGCVAKYITWMGKDEDEKEQKPIGKSIKRYIFWAVIVESIASIMKVFGL